MKRSDSYNTKQREAVLALLMSSGGEHFTAAQIENRLGDSGMRIGRATVYRCLDRLVEKGTARRFLTDGAPACYQYNAGTGSGDIDCHTHFHLKCEVCGALRHLECDALNDLERHVYKEHSFLLNAYKTVLYGRCESCME